MIFLLNFDFNVPWKQLQKIFHAIPWNVIYKKNKISTANISSILYMYIQRDTNICLLQNTFCSLQINSKQTKVISVIALHCTDCWQIFTVNWNECFYLHFVEVTFDVRTSHEFDQIVCSKYIFFISTSMTNVSYNQYTQAHISISFRVYAFFSFFLSLFRYLSFYSCDVVCTIISYVKKFFRVIHFPNSISTSA